MEEKELRAIAELLLKQHGAAAFAAALAQAAALSQNGELGTAACWQEISEKVSEIEATRALQNHIRR